LNQKAGAIRSRESLGKRTREIPHAATHVMALKALPSGAWLGHPCFIGSRSHARVGSSGLQKHEFDNPTKKAPYEIRKVLKGGG
jgi:hypothetical protein